MSSNELVLKKKETAKVNFDDGVIIDIPGKERPRHLQFLCKTSTSGNAEACDLRLSKRVKAATDPVISWTTTAASQTSRRLNEAFAPALLNDRRALETEPAAEGFQCGNTLFEEKDRAANRLESPVFFRMGYNE